MAVTTPTRWERITVGHEVHMIPADDAVKHEPTVRCFCNPDAEKTKNSPWVVFHQRVSR